MLYHRRRISSSRLEACHKIDDEKKLVCCHPRGFPHPPWPGRSGVDRMCQVAGGAGNLRTDQTDRITTPSRHSAITRLISRCIRGDV